MKSLKTIASIIVIWAFLLNIFPSDYSHASSSDLLSLNNQNNKKPAGTPPKKLSQSQQNVQSLINQKNDALKLVSHRAKVTQSQASWALPVYYADGRLQSITFSSPDASDVTYYHYLDENWNNQGYGRVDRQILSDGTILSPGNKVTGFMDGAALIILGTTGDDNIKISQNGSKIIIATPAGNLTFTGTINQIKVYGFDGNDTITASFSVLTPVGMYGGSGNDQLFADNSARDVLVAGEGDDLLVAINSIQDTLVGGSGLDSFWADSKDLIQNLTPLEIADNTLHRVDQFYQPFTTEASNPYYTPLSMQGQNLADPTDSGTTINVSSHPLFNNGVPYYNDIQQGALGDCYFLAGLSSLASQQPNIILQSIAPLGDGTYAVRFYDNGVASYLRIDGDISVSGGSPIYDRFGSGGDVWAMLLEKALAFFRSPGANTYASISGGQTEEPFNALTGVGNTRFDFNIASDVGIYNFLKTQLLVGQAVTLGSWGGGGPYSPIMSRHAYSLQSVEMDDGVMYVTLYNPWGCDGVSYDNNPSDGLLTISISQLRQYFLYACSSLLVTSLKTI